MTTRLLILLCSLLFARSLSAAPYKPQCRGADGKLVQCSGTLDNAQAPTAIAAGTLTGTVPVANGGTNKASWTVGSIPVATAGTTIGEIAPGTANHVLTSNGTGAAPTMQALPTASSGTSTLGSAFALTSTDTYQDTGLSVSLPSSGTYLLTAQVKATLVSTTGAPYATCRLFNVTAGAVVTSSELLVAFGTATSTYYINTATESRTLTVGAASTIRLECARRQASAWSVSEISSDVDGRTAVTYVKLAS